MDFAYRVFIEKRNSFLTVHGKTVGIETLRAGQVHILSGLGPRLSGEYFFTKVRHKIKPGDRGALPYTCEFEAYKRVKG
jgi:hypothetical protein